MKLVQFETEGYGVPQKSSLTNSNSGFTTWKYNINPNKKRLFPVWDY